MKLHNRLLLLLFFSFACLDVSGQDTFSIVAVDTTTGEIGSAGASCVTFQNIGAFIISDVIEGIGAVHTQSYWLSANQVKARNYMLAGYSPQQIIDSLVANDAQGNPHIRQYGVIDLTRNGESAAYTGVNCLDYKNHVTGPCYAIQGNILLGQHVIDSMHTAFLNSNGLPLADRLMKTLQAAKIVGADSRCTSNGTSSLSAFIKVVRIGDNGNYYLQEIVPNTTANVDPIDLLQEKFDQWKINKFNIVDPFLSQLTSSTDTLFANDSSSAVITIIPKNNSDTLLAPGLQIILSNMGHAIFSSVIDLGNGIYEAVLIAQDSAAGIDTISAVVISGNDSVNIEQKVIINYVQPPVSVRDYYRINEFSLSNNYPNPFNPATVISYSIPQSCFVTIKIFDALGREVKTLVNEEKPAGNYDIKFNADKLSSGLYFFKIKAGEFVQAKKMILLR